MRDGGLFCLITLAVLIINLIGAKVDTSDTDYQNVIDGGSNR